MAKQSTNFAATVVSLQRKDHWNIIDLDSLEAQEWRSLDFWDYSSGSGVISQITSVAPRSLREAFVALENPSNLPTCHSRDSFFRIGFLLMFLLCTDSEN